MSDDDVPGPLFVKELIRSVHKELRESRAERLAANEAPIFEVDQLVIEVNFVAVRTKEGKGGIDFRIITAGGGVSFEDQQVHKVTLSMSAASAGPDGLIALEEADTTRFRPRLD